MHSLPVGGEAWSLSVIGARRITWHAGGSHASRSMLLCSVKGVRFGEEVGDLLGEGLGAGAGKADGGDDGSGAAPQPEEPALSAGPSSGGGRAGVDLDGDGGHGWDR